MSDTPSPASSSADRRLAAIAFTDVVGYSAHMQRNETGTLALVRADFAAMRQCCTDQGGEVLKSTGDGLLLCFSSAIQAVACALQIQAAFAARPGDALKHRIGIHLGDIFREAGDVAGDGVNIAARLEGRAPPGGVCLSQAVYDVVKGKLPMHAVALGPQQFKNIADPIRVYIVAPDGAPTAGTRPRGRRLWRWGVVAALGLAAALATILIRHHAYQAPAVPPPVPAAAVANEKSLAVLPFTNMSDEADNAFFADGVHEDLLTNLANISALKVVSRTSVLQYRRTTKTIPQIARELGVAYVLEGSVRRAGDRVRVTGQLIKAATDEHSWAKTYDRELKDIFAVQADLAREIADALRAVISPAEAANLTARPTSNMAAYDCFQKARALDRAIATVNDRRDTIVPLLQRAVALDPGYAAAWAELSQQQLTLYEMADHTEARLTLARQALAEAERLAPDAYAVLNAAAELAASLGDRATVEARQRRILALFPQRAESQLTLALDAWHHMRWADAQTNFRAALQLDPHNPEVLENYFSLLDSMRRWDEAEPVAATLAEVQPDNLDVRLMAASMIFRRSGSTAQLTRLLAELPQGPRAETGEIVVRSRIAYLTGDWAGIVALWRETGARFRTGSPVESAARLMLAGAFLKLHDPSSARPLLEQNREELTRQLQTDPANIGKWNDLAVALGMLGERAAARTALDRAEKLIANAHREPGTYFYERWNHTVARAWVDDKSAVIAAIGPLLREPAPRPSTANVHVLRVWWVSIPLHGDPEFETMLNDPRNNAPLF